MPRYWLVAAACTVAAAATFVVPSSAQAEALEWRDTCDDKQYKDVECATLRVPADWATGRGDVHLSVARRKAPADRKIGTIVYLPGGPGDSGVSQLIGGNRLSEAAAQRFDIIALDPRGTNRSSPVRCDPELLRQTPDVNPDKGARLDTVVKYSRALAATCGPAELLDNMDSRDVARDVEAVRAAVGEKQISLYSRSYGTLAAQMYAEMFPHRVRANVLDSVFDHSLSTRQFVETSVRGVEDSFNAFAQWCAATQSCALHGKDAGVIFDELYRKAESGELTEPSDPGYTISPTELSWLTMRVWLYKPDWPGLADRLARLAGLLPPGAPVKFPATPPQGDFPMAAFCADHRMTFRSDHEWREEWARLKAIAPHMRTHMSWQIASICAGWPVPASNPQAKPGIRVPVLLINSRYDPATPIAWAANVSRMIPRSALLTYEGAGHGVYLRTDCTKQITDKYFIDLVLPAPGTSCPSA